MPANPSHWKTASYEVRLSEEQVSRLVALCEKFDCMYANKPSLSRLLQRIGDDKLAVVEYEEDDMM